MIANKSDFMRVQIGIFMEIYEYHVYDIYILTHVI